MFALQSIPLTHFIWRPRKERTFTSRQGLPGSALQLSSFNRLQFLEGSRKGTTLTSRQCLPSSALQSISFNHLLSLKGWRRHNAHVTARSSSIGHYNQSHFHTFSECLGHLAKSRRSPHIQFSSSRHSHLQTLSAFGDLAKPRRSLYATVFQVRRYFPPFIDFTPLSLTRYVGLLLVLVNPTSQPQRTNVTSLV